MIQTFRERFSRSNQAQEAETGEASSGADGLPVVPEIPPNWQDILTQSLSENCLTPSDEAVLFSYDLYCDVLAEPFHARADAMAVLYSDISAGIAALQILAPSVIEEAVAQAALMHTFEPSLDSESRGESL